MLSVAKLENGNAESAIFLQSKNTSEAVGLLRFVCVSPFFKVLLVDDFVMFSTFV